MKKEKTRMTKDIVPEGFTIPLATVDAIPVLFFGLDAILLSRPLHSVLFLVGACLSFLAGFCKVLWKYIVVLEKKNVWGLFIQMRILMPIGFLLMLLGFIFRIPSLDLGSVGTALTTFPGALFYLLWLLGMVAMMVLAKMLDSSDLRSNWIEQCVNGIAQIALFIGILLSI